jgi:hypothetical protein
MTKPFDEQYVNDRDAAAESRGKRQCSTGQADLDKAISWYLEVGFQDGADWSKQYFDAKVEELERKLSQNKCNSGHETLPIVLWDCPECVRIRTEKLEQRIEGMKWYGRVVFTREGIVREREYTSKDLAQAYADGANDMKEQYDLADCEDGCLEDMIGAYSNLEAVEE